MKIKELLNLLNRFDENLEVHISQPSHDHWKTELAPALEKCETVFIEHNGYHDADATLDCDEGGEDELQKINSGKATKVLILR